MSELREYVESMEESGTIWPAAAEMYYLADTAETDSDRLRDVTQVYESKFGRSEDATDDHWIASDIYLLLGQPGAAREEAERTLGKRNLMAETWAQYCLQYLSEQTPAAEARFVKAAGPFGDRRLHVHYYVGMVALANGERTKAREHFEQAKRYGRMDWWSHVWSYAFSERMKGDPNWPHWIPNSQID
jgi:hypothetical protein